MADSLFNRQRFLVVTVVDIFSREWALLNK